MEALLREHTDIQSYPRVVVETDRGTFVEVDTKTWQAHELTFPEIVYYGYTQGDDYDMLWFHRRQTTTIPSDFIGVYRIKYDIGKNEQGCYCYCIVDLHFEKYVYPYAPPMEYYPIQRQILFDHINETPRKPRGKQIHDDEDLIKAPSKPRRRKSC